MAETVLVTGGTGFIAGWCVKLLLERGYAVRTTARSLGKEAALRAAIGNPAEGLTVFAADLTDDAGWTAAMDGCGHVLHVASPLGTGPADDPAAFIAAAREGTLRVLRAAVDAGVRRVVMTSAAATARAPRGSGVTSDETVWADPDDPQFDVYRRSKILAERAAWDFMARGGGATTLATVLPTAVFGPVLSRDNLGSVAIVQGLLHGRPPRAPRLGFWIVDVRDLADLHIRAMTAPEAAGQRFLAAGEFMWMLDIAKALRTGLGERAKKAPKKEMPDAIVRAMALLTPQLRVFTPDLGRKAALNGEKARRMLGFTPRAGATTVVDCGESLLSVGAA